MEVRFRNEVRPLEGDVKKGARVARAGACCKGHVRCAEGGSPCDDPHVHAVALVVTLGLAEALGPACNQCNRAAATNPAKDRRYFAFSKVNADCRMLRR